MADPFVGDSFIGLSLAAQPSDYISRDRSVTSINCAISSVKCHFLYSGTHGPLGVRYLICRKKQLCHCYYIIQDAFNILKPQGWLNMLPVHFAACCKAAAATRPAGSAAEAAADICYTPCDPAK